MNRLWVHLSLGSALIVIGSVLLVALLIYNQVNTRFRSFLMQERVLTSPLMRDLSSYYASNGTWDGITDVFRDHVAAREQGSGGRRGIMGLPGSAGFTLTDADGRVVYAVPPRPPLQGEQPDIAPQPATVTYLSTEVLARAVPIVIDQRTAGYLLVHSPMGGLSTAAALFLRQVNTALLWAGSIAGGLGILFGLVLARSLVTPLDRLAQAARQIAQGDLQQRVPVTGSVEMAALAAAFNGMAASLQQSEHARRQMVADLAHELRSPLSVVQGNLQAMLDGVYPLEPTELAIIYDETVLLSRLITDLNELARADAGQLALALQPLALAPVIEQAVAGLVEQAEAQHIAFSVELQTDLPPVLVDRERIRQVLHNLLVNALRYTPAEGRITVTATQHIDRVSSVEVAIADTGVGIAEADLPHVFERFWRADRSRARDQERSGSGLGLAIAERLITAHGGSIGVESTPGIGSRFWFRLPVVPAQDHTIT